MPLTTRLLTAGLTGLLLSGTLAVPAAATAAPAARVKAATTSATEKRRVDSVPTPKLKWSRCYGYAQCATASVPLDYDKPKGAKIKLALLRVKATDQKHKIGSLFVNPGGPGAPATDLALAAPLFLSNSVLRRFDIVGMDPRGIGGSTNVNCFGTTAKQTAALQGMTVPFPVGAEEEAAYIASAEAFGRACSTTGAPLAASMSTAEVARDMDVMRRAVGDKKLNYLGFSYGTALGQYYANMFPDRFRTIAVDGVINPVSWVGTPATRDTIQDDRLNSAGGAYRALVEILNRCDKVGTRRCVFAGDAKAKFRTLANRLLAAPVTIDDPELGTISITYAGFVSDVLSLLYLPIAGDIITAYAQAVSTLATPEATTAQLSAAGLSVARLTKAHQLGVRAYDNSFESYAAVSCTDGLHPAQASSWPALTAASDRRAPYFGRAWGWSTAQCALSTWTARDEDAYTGPFTKRTASPVLVIGSRWDPATNYYDAVAAARMLPNSRLLTSNNWGHTAYGTSRCATGAIDRYLLSVTLPVKGHTCTGADQPFTTALPAASAKSLRAATKSEIAAPAAAVPDSEKQLPPVARR